MAKNGILIASLRNFSGISILLGMADEKWDSPDPVGKVWAASWERVEEYREALNILDKVFPIGEEDKRKALAHFALAYCIERKLRPSEIELVTYFDSELLEIGYRFRKKKHPEVSNDEPEPEDPDPPEGRAQ